MMKKLRFLFQFTFFVLTSLILLGVITELSSLRAYYALHVFPAFSYLSWVLLPPFWLITLGILLLPLLFGRIYCSFICPVGFLQDIAERLARRIHVAEHRSAARYTPLRLSILVFSLFAVFFGISAFGYFDHFSNLGRLFSLHRLSFSLSLGIGFIFLFVIIFMPAVMPRWFCTAICPSGALFAFLGKKSFYKMRRSEICTACGLCESACPAACIDAGMIDYDVCIACLECARACPIKALSYGRMPKRKDNQTDQGRRNLIRTLGGSILGVFGSLTFEHFFGKQTASAKVIAPGAKSADQFFAKCHSCNLCVSVCPTGVLTPVSFEGGITMMAKPVMDYSRSYCSYECNSCLAVCPSDALSYYPLPRKKLIKIGSTKLDQELCIPYVKNQDCAACAEHCPSGAIKMKPKENQEDRKVPEVDDNYCIGCGICQWICPVRPKRAIIVEPKQVHSVAYDPKPKKSKGPQKLSPEVEKEFPF